MQFLFSKLFTNFAQYEFSEDTVYYKEIYTYALL